MTPVRPGVRGADDDETMTSSYRIRSGDTLSGIARQHNTTVDALARANNIEDPNKIREGQTLQIPDGFDRPAARTAGRRPRGRSEDSFSAAPRPRSRPGGQEPASRRTTPQTPGARRPGAQAPASRPDTQARAQTLRRGNATPALRPDVQAQAAQRPVAADQAQALRPAAQPQAALGGLSRQYEARGGPGTVSSGQGDHGGVSYGSYQFATNNGSAQEFVNSLRTSHPDYHAALSGHAPGTEAFSTAWRDLAARDPQGFDQAQHDYIQATHYDVAAAGIQRNTGIDLSTRSAALRDVAWSTAVQHGPGRADDIFATALAGRDPATVTDEQLIQGIYAERGRRNGDGELAYFSSSSADVQAGVAQRFVDEQATALGMLRQEQAGGAAAQAPVTAPIPRPRPEHLTPPASQPLPENLTPPLPRPRPENLTPPIPQPRPDDLTPLTSRQVAAPDPASARQVQVPYYSQFEGGHGFTPGNTACFDAAKAMIGTLGVTVQGSDRRIQVGTSEDTRGRLTVDSARAQEGRNYIDSQLDAGRPVMVGVSHRDDDYNADQLTDHFVVITGRGVDEQGRTYYSFHDPGTRHTQIGADTNPNNRFYVDDSTGMMYRPAQDGTSIDRRAYDVSMVRING
ncbi:LysM peptidoglycan-binding domain-containing protein [Archangium violaceum]|uniref:VgrG-related protein n=1 Tax=Archangium violaceum TaxID=83451 RepID=UPI000A04F42F|nr:LysM peptidoglycan-binding domain-containing protein [Archangium violaceum]